MSGVTDRLQAMAVDAANRHGIDSALFRALITQESAWNPKAVSSAGARGLGQLMPGTAAALGVSNPFDPAQALDGAARYFRQQLDRFGDPRLALAAYNAGPGAVAKYGDVPPFPETQNYVQKILGAAGGNQAGTSYTDPVLAAFAGGTAGTPQAKPAAAPASGYQDPVLAAFSGQSPASIAAPAGRNQGPGNAPVDISGLAARTKANLTGLHPEIQSALTGAASDLQNQGIDLGSLITSGYRSPADQARLYNNRGSNPNPVAAPGHSPHESGAAVDISLRSLSPDQQNAVMSSLQAHGLTRPMATDPVHWQLSGASPSAAGAATAGAYQDPVLKAFGL